MSRGIPWHLLLFPGVVLHEFAHYLACILIGVKVREVKFWGWGGAFVAHEQPNSWKSLIITVAPFLLGNWLALEILPMATGPFLSPLSLLYLWLAISLTYFSFPSRADAANSFNSFISFYKIHILHKGQLISRLFWLLTFPFLFIPLALLLGLIVVFDYSSVMRWVWTVGILTFSAGLPVLFF